MTIAASALPAASFFAPTGRLRACINLGNPVLAQRDPQTQSVVGVSVDMARAFAQRLGVAVELQVVESASQSVQAVTQGQADIGFFAIDPLRGAGIAFTAPYVLIEGGYLVPQASATHAADEVDRPGMRVAVGKGSAYDLFLTRELLQAEIVRSPTPSGVVEMCVKQGLEVAAGIKQALEADAQRIAGLRLLPGRFMVIQQAMGCSRDRGIDAAVFLHAFVEDLKSSGFIQQALARHGIQGCSVAPTQPV
jgi:polar amino acid transport system substrate-binding protein